MSKQAILEMKNYVVESYAMLFNCNLGEAEKIVGNSSFIKTLNENPEYVMHYDDEYWARRINNEVNGYVH
ncbi:MAG TPA: hypothetical protein GX497_02190 [Bacillus bacterium]|nr:hypothetical protein [Bacillus sp. (in: firmicutes)]